MAATESTMLPLGSVAPSFSLPDTDGNIVSLDDFPDSKGYLVMFICNHCPFVIHVRSKLAEVGRRLQHYGIAVVAINSNDVDNYPDDAPDKMAEEVKKAGYTFPYLHDETQQVAQAYKAACTPDFYLFDAEKKLVYRGRMDASRPGNDTPVTGQDLQAAVEALLTGSDYPEQQLPSIGCNIKWKPGNEPSYFG